jgi:hypothetical protein
MLMFCAVGSVVGKFFGAGFAYGDKESGRFSMYGNISCAGSAGFAADRPAVSCEGFAAVTASTCRCGMLFGSHAFSLQNVWSALFSLLPAGKQRVNE